MRDKDKVLTFRVNQKELDRINAKREEIGIRNMGAYLRKMAMDGYAQNHGIPINSFGNGIAMKCQAKELCVLSLSEQKNLCGYLMENMDSKNLGILICLLTGLRIGEICALRWEDISLSEKSLYVHSTLQRIQDLSDDNPRKTKISISSPKSQCSIRTIPLTDDIVSLIFTVFPNQSGFVLTGDDKCFVEPRSMQNHFKSVCIAASISKVNFHERVIIGTS